MARTLLAAFAVGLVLAGSAHAQPPSLTSVTQQSRHAAATFSAPKSDDASIYFSTKPDRASDGSFLQENIATLDLLTDAEIQAGRWSDERQLNPGTYWVMMRASPDFDLCWIFDLSAYDPSCADGYSNVLQLVVPRPTIRYAARVSVYRFLRQVSLELVAAPLGEKQPYRMCYRLKSRALRCLRGTLDGFDWNSSASDELTVPSGNLATITTFSWYVGTARVLSKRVRVR